MLAKMLLDHINNPQPPDAPEPEPSEPAEKLFAADFEASPAFNGMIGEAYARRMPSAAVRQQYRESFARFKEFCAPNGVDPLQATGPIVAAWLAQLADGDEPRPLQRVRDGLAAVEYFRWLARRDAFADAVLIAAEIIEAGLEDDDGGGGGGGKKIEDTTATTEAPVAETEQQLPLAAAEPQH
jgi:hypothetical protein